MPIIPVNPTAYPTEAEPMDVAITYKVQITKLDLAPKLDKNNRPYLQLETEVLEPQAYQGAKLNRGYIQIPDALSGNMSEGEVRAAKNAGVTLRRLYECFGLRAGSDGLDTSQAIGNVGIVSIEQGEYMGRKTFSIKDFLIEAKQ